MWFLIDESLLGWMDRCYKYNMCVCNKRKSKSSLSLSLLAFKHCNHHQIYVAIDVILISSIHLKPFRILKWTWWVKNSRKKKKHLISTYTENIITYTNQTQVEMLFRSSSSSSIPLFVVQLGIFARLIFQCFDMNVWKKRNKK